MTYKLGNYWSIGCLKGEYNESNEVKSAVRSFERDLVNNAKKNPKMIYSCINSKKTIKDNIRALNDKIGKRIEDPA